MANQVYTPGLFITTSPNLVEQIVLNNNNKTIESIFDSITEEENQYILYSPKKGNSGLLEATINIIDADRSAESSKLTLKFVELSESFERLVDSTNYVNFILNNLQKDDLNGFRDLFSISEFKIYVSYGIGNDLKNWSSFNQYILTDSNISYDEFGIKIVTMVFSCNPSPFIRINSFSRKAASYFTKNNYKYTTTATGQKLNIEASVPLYPVPAGISNTVPVVRNDNNNVRKPLTLAIKKYLQLVLGIKEDNIFVNLPIDIKEKNLKNVAGITISDEWERASIPLNNPDALNDIPLTRTKYEPILKISTKINPDNSSQSDIKVAGLPEWWIPLEALNRKFIKDDILVESEGSQYISVDFLPNNQTSRWSAISETIASECEVACPESEDRKLKPSPMSEVKNMSVSFWANTKYPST